MKNCKKEHQQNEENPAMMNQAVYHCTMQCEGDKTYNEPGDCPVCGMHLVPAKSAGHDAEGIMQFGHGHHHHGNNMPM